ncbi:hypothetical protein QFC19_002764 [Naganishia cerealis]|uniref:Uncharacterized protein n=1 Tax=Naganishia cerealis TaxID=610337 RepID=A0ACC2W7Z3_9TREE|nr:hypothetical protein QFC19_002764 [Naganishia cerealis]
MAYSNSSAARPEHARLTSSAYLLHSDSRSPTAKTYEDVGSRRDYDNIGNGRPGGGGGSEHGGHDPNEPLIGIQAVRLGSSFFVFGMLIAMQFSVVVAAAGDLVGDQAPKSAVLTAYTLPSVTVRLLVPFATFPNMKPLLRRIPLVNLLVPQAVPRPRRASTTAPGDPEKEETEVNYPSRIAICSICSFLGLNLLAWTDNLFVRLVGIALASCSSNLGDLSFYQMATRYPLNTIQSVGLYTSGGGAAGLVGALTYTVLTQLGASPSAVISGTGFVPLIIVLLYNFWLPPFPPIEKEVKKPGQRKEVMIKDLGTRAKIGLAKPMLKGYMLPLCALFLVELTNVQGVLATVIFYIPFTGKYFAYPTLLNGLFPAKRSFYPVYQTLYQLAAFMGRSTATLARLPGGKRQDARSLWILVGVEGLILAAQARESMSMRGADDATVWYGPWTVLFLILAMGMCGGALLANVYYRIGRHPLPEGVFRALVKARAIKRAAMREYEILEDEDFENEFDEEERDAHEEEEELDMEEELARGRRSHNDNDAMNGFAVRPSVRLSRNPSLASIKSIREERRAEDESALREFVISSIGAADTLAILLASLIAMVVEPRLCSRQISSGRTLCVAIPGGAGPH